MGKILALDVGTKRIGYAVSDESRTIAFPRGTVLQIPQEILFQKLTEIVKEEGISKLVVGLPLDSENEERENANKIRAFGEQLARTLSLPVFYVDEFGTTDEALSKIPLRKDRRRKGYRDAIAAQIILQRYLDAQ